MSDLCRSSPTQESPSCAQEAPAPSADQGPSNSSLASMLGLQQPPPAPPDGDDPMWAAGQSYAVLLWQELGFSETGAPVVAILEDASAQGALPSAQDAYAALFGEPLEDSLRKHLDESALEQALQVTTPAPGECATDDTQPLNENEAVRALTIAVDIMQGGDWWFSEPLPPAYSKLLLRLYRAVDFNQQTDLSAALAEFEAVVCALQPTVAYNDPMWVESVFDPAVTGCRDRMRLNIVNDFIIPDEDGVPQASELATLESSIDELSIRLVEIDNGAILKTLAVSRKMAGMVRWGELTADKAIVDPLTGETSTFNSLASISGYLNRAKNIIRLAQAINGQDNLNELPADATEALKQTKLIIQGTASLTAVAFEASALVFREAALWVPGAAEAATLEALADDCVKAAGAIAASKALTGVLSGLGLLYNLSILADRGATRGERADAAMGAMTSAATLGSATSGMLFSDAAFAATVGSVCTAVSVALPVSWLATTEAIRQLGKLEVSFMETMVIDSFQAIPERCEAIRQATEPAVTAYLLWANEEDPEQRSLFHRVLEERLDRIWIMAKSYYKAIPTNCESAARALRAPLTEYVAGGPLPLKETNEVLADIYEAAQEVLDNLVQYVAEDLEVIPPSTERDND